MQQALTLAKETLCPPDVTCDVVQDGAVVSTGRGMGVKPLLSIFNSTPQLLKGAAVADTVIGKAAAMLRIHAGAVAVYGEVMSRPAVQALEAHDLGIAQFDGRDAQVLALRDDLGNPRAAHDLAEPCDGEE